MYICRSFFEALNQDYLLCVGSCELVNSKSQSVDLIKRRYNLNSEANL